MPIKIVVPELGESIVEATVARWLKREGDDVAVGEAVAELETDKVNLEVGAERTGVLVRIERKEGEDVKVGDVLGVIEEAPVEVSGPPKLDGNQGSRGAATGADALASGRESQGYPRGQEPGPGVWRRSGAGARERSRREGDQGGYPELSGEAEGGQTG